MIPRLVLAASMMLTLLTRCPAQNPGPETARFEAGLRSIDPKDAEKLARFCLGFIDSRDDDIATKCCDVLSKASDTIIRKVTANASRVRLRRMIGDRGANLRQRQLCAYLLGSCGNANDAVFLRETLDSLPERDGSRGTHFLVGYILLDPRGGWDYTCSFLRNSDLEFIQRYAALNAVRFFLDNRPGQISEAKKTKALISILKLGDMAELVIEDLIRRGIWDLTGDVLALHGKESHQQPIVRRAILRFALACPNARCAEFVGARRNADPEGVRVVEEGLRM